MDQTTTSSQRPRHTLHFTNKNGVNTLSFDCSGSPGFNWPSYAITPYKFQNGKLAFLDYYDNSYGYYVADSFRWITPGEEFEVELRQVLIYMSAKYLVNYKKL